MDKKLIFLLIVFFSFFSFFSLMLVSRRSTGFLTRAEANDPSAEKSLIIAWPLSVNLKEPTEVKITVFIMNKNQVPLANKKVTLTSNMGKFRENDLMTDKLGKAEFYLLNDSPGIANIEAIVNDNIPLKNKVSIKFE